MTNSPPGPAIVAQNVVKRFGEVTALNGVDLEVPRGSVLGLLGPNGAGKTTMVNILTTLAPMTSGRASVEGIDVSRSPAGVREVIGLAGQNVAVDEILTGRENLELVGGLFHLSRSKAVTRAGELLERFDLVDAADRQSKTYSGGMRRRLDLAASLMHHPQVLFLDEPTSGLDPRSRLVLWDVTRELVKGGTTVLLTTQYLEEADQLADNVVVIDHGRVIASGTPVELKARTGGEFVHFTIEENEIDAAIAATNSLVEGGAQVDRAANEIVLPAGDRGADVLLETVRRLDAAKVSVSDIGIRRPSLDDVFMSLTGHHTSEDNSSAGELSGADKYV